MHWRPTHSKFWGDVSPRPPKVYASESTQNAFALSYEPGAVSLILAVIADELALSDFV